MTKQEHIEHWKSGSIRDLETAKKMVDSGFYDWALFIGHLSLEKILKALWIQHNEGNIPPKIHNLVILANKSNLNIDDKTKTEFSRINSFYLESRYQNYKAEMYKIATKEFAENNIKIIEDYQEWLLKMLK